MSSPARADTDLGNDAHASTVLCSNPVSVLTQPSSILKTHHEGIWLSPTRPAPAPTTGDPALSALLVGLQAPEASTHPRTPPRTRRVQVSPIISVIDSGGFETFEKEEIRAFHRSRTNQTFKHEVYAKELVQQALAQES